MKIPNEIIPVVYDISVKVYKKEMTLTEGAAMLFERNKMNINSAKDYINDFKYLMQGKRFTRTLNAYSIEYVIARIYKDYGPAQLSHSLSALEAHIEYYEGCHSTALNKLRAIHVKYSEKAHSS